MKTKWTAVAAAIVLLATAPAFAGPITSDLTITGEIEFDTGYALTADNAMQGGDFGVIEGGASSGSHYDDETVTTGSAIVSGAFTDFGDGFEIAGASEASHDGTDGGEFAVGMDFFFEIENTSLDDWKVTFKVDLTKNFVNADGIGDDSVDDAFADSELTVDDPLSEVFFSDIVSDTSFGDEDGGVSLGTYGVSITKSGMLLFDVTVAAGTTEFVDGAWTLDGGAFGLITDFAEAELIASVTIDSAMNLTGTTPVVPLPPAGFAGLALLAGIFGLRKIRRRTR